MNIYTYALLMKEEIAHTQVQYFGKTDGGGGGGKERKKYTHKTHAKQV